MNSPILPFREPLLSDALQVRRCTEFALQSDLSFVNIYLLKNKYGTEILFHMEHLIRRFTGNGRLQGYTFPVGGNRENLLSCIRDIEAHCRHLKEPFRFCLLTKEQAEFLCETYGKKVQISCDSGDADYLYKRENLENLPGTAYHKKRTHVSKFLRNFPHATMRKLDGENSKDALSVAESWLNSQVDSPALHHEYKAIYQAINYREELGIDGGIVYIDELPVAMALVSRINDRVSDIHYEKCVPEYRDAYTFINRELAAKLNTEWINREEDLNVPGLRKAKLSYHPALVLQKYNATIYVD